MRENITVVRLTRNRFKRSSGAFVEQVELKVIKRKSKGICQFEEDYDAIGSDTLKLIINLHEYEDGLYELILCNVSHDYETGYPDSWKYKLIPYIQDKSMITYALHHIPERINMKCPHCNYIGDELNKKDDTDNEIDTCHFTLSVTSKTDGYHLEFLHDEYVCPKCNKTFLD